MFSYSSPQSPNIVRFPIPSLTRMTSYNYPNYKTIHNTLTSHHLTPTLIHTPTITYLHTPTYELHHLMQSNFNAMLYVCMLCYVSYIDNNLVHNILLILLKRSIWIYTKIQHGKHFRVRVMNGSGSLFVCL